jgi:hypothetical protein
MTVKLLLIIIGIIMAIVISLAELRKRKSRQKSEAPLSPLDPDKSQPLSPDKQASAADSSDVAASSQAVEAPVFATLQRRPWMLIDLLRVLLIVLSLAVAGVLALVLLPQPAVDGLVRNLQARHEGANPEPIAFLYLGDEIANNELHIRGVVRNITAVPIEQLDAIVRFYAYDRSLLETTIVRMSKDIIDPGEIAQFELVYPNYQMEFTGYSAEFKLRQGALVPYKDMRTRQARPD